MSKVVRRLASGCFALCLILMLSVTTVFATMAAYGSEKAGYLVATHQLRKKTNTFDDSALNKKYKSYMTYGAKVWKDCGVITLKRNRSSINKISMYRETDTNVKAYHWLAYQHTSSVDKGGKILQFEIKFNIEKMKNLPTARGNSVAAHEIGHSFGLLDLYEKRNQDQLMYGIANKDNAKPTAKDIKGGKYATRK